MIVANMFVKSKFATNAFVGYDRDVQPAPRSRRERPAKPALSREGIVQAAMTVLADDGFDKLTMRRLAVDLDTGPASLYVYVANTTELHALVIDRLLADLDLEWESSVDWRTRLRELLSAYVMLLVKHPGLARSALVVWPDGPHYLDLVESVLGLLIRGGISSSRAAWGVDILLQVATGMGVEYGSRGQDGGQQETDLIRTLQAATPERHPILSELGPDRLVGGDQGDRHRWALDAVIAGVADTPLPGESAPESPPGG